MTISFRDRLAQTRATESMVVNETAYAAVITKPAPEPTPYQDAVTYPCFSPGGIATITDDSKSPVTPQPPGSTGLTNTEKLLQRLLDVAGGGAVPGAYRSINITIPANEQRYEIQLGIYATQMNIRCDQDVMMIFNNTQFDTISLEVGDFPLSINDLRMNETIHTIYITTTVDTEVQILAFGSIK